MQRDMFRQVVERQIKGLMFHSNMADYYDFLNLNEFAQYHNCQYLEESKTLREIKDYYITHYHKTLIVENTEPIFNITPIEWDEKTSVDVDETTLKALLKSSLEAYWTWENDTARYYTEAADKFFNAEYYDDYCFMRKLIDDVNLEKCHIQQWMIDLSSVDYDIHKIKGFWYKLNSK